jgi:fatty acid synthase subunit beta
MAGSYEESLDTALGRSITAKVAEAQQLKKPIDLARGKATIPLKGIDVPFHSSYLRPSVPAYRKYLIDKVKVEDIVPERLVGKFIPNVMARPFSLDREYFEEAARLTGSDVLKSIALTGAA